jgi:hypothetical protein
VKLVNTSCRHVLAFGFSHVHSPHQKAGVVGQQRGNPMFNSESNPGLLSSTQEFQPLLPVM